MAEEKMRLRPGRGRTTSSRLVGASTSTSQATLPPEIVQKAVNRLGWTGLVYACTYFVMFWIHLWAHQGDPFIQQGLPFFSGATVAAVGLGLIIFVVARSKRLPPLLMLDLGLVFEVVAGFLIALVEAWQPLTSATDIRGVSCLTVWVVFFSLVVRATLGKASISAFATAAMGPLGMA